MKRIIAPQSDQWLENYRAVRREIGGRYAAEWRLAGPWRRCALWYRIEREVRAEMKRRFPPGALYVNASVN